MMRIARNTFVLPLLLGAGLLAACGDDAPAPASGPSGSKTPAQPTDTPEPEGVPERVELPEVSPITAPTALGVLRSSLLALPPSGHTETYETTVRVLGYLADLRDDTLEEPVRLKLLAKEDGEFNDLEYAAIGCATLHRAGDAAAAETLLAIARQAIDNDDSMEAVAQSLAVLDGPHANASDRLLVEMVTSELDDEAAAAAVRILAQRRSKAGREAFHMVATGDAFDEIQHGTAVAGLLAIGDDRARPIIDAWVASADKAADLDDVLVGLGVEGITEAVPVIQEIMQALEATGSMGFEPSMACIALGTIYKDGGGEEHLELVRSYMAIQDADAIGEGTLALLRMGDPGAIDSLVPVLERHVRDPARGDVELTVEILETLAARGLASDPRLAQVVNVGAFAQADPSLPDNFRIRGRGVNHAAAYAYLKSQK